MPNVTIELSSAQYAALGKYSRSMNISISAAAREWFRSGEYYSKQADRLIAKGPDKQTTVTRTKKPKKVKALIRKWSGS